MQAHGKVRDAAPDEGVPAGGAERTTNTKGCLSNNVVISFSLLAAALSAAHVSSWPDMRAAASRLSASARCLSRADGLAPATATSGEFARASDGAAVVSPSPVVDPRSASTTRVDGPRRSAPSRARRWSANARFSSLAASHGGDALPKTTRAVVFDAHGHPSRVLRVDEAFPVAALGPEDVLVRFTASPVNPSDVNVVEGTYPLRPKSFPAVGGGEGVGEVVRFGARVDKRSLAGGDDEDAFADEDALRDVPTKVVPDVPGLGTWREFAVFPAAALRRVPARVPDELAAQMCVNLPTALRMLQDFADLGADFEEDLFPQSEFGGADVPENENEANQNNKKTVAMNAPTSAVARAAIQMCAARGVPVVCSLRARESRDAWERDAAYLKSLGASLVVLDAASRDGGGFRTRDALETLQTLPPVKLALNGVGGASSASLAGSLADGGVMVTYGGMARAPAHVPTGAAIFNSVTATGFWLTRWSEDKRRAESLARRTRNGGSSGFAPDAISNLAFARARMFNRLVGMVDRGELSMPLRSVQIDGFVDALRAREGKVGEGKIALWMGR